MNRRNFFPSLAAVALVAAIPVQAEPAPRNGLRLIAKFDEPITAMTTYKGQVVVACANAVYLLPTEGLT